MTIKQKQDKLEQRAAALRENLKKRKAAVKPSQTKTAQDSKDGSAQR